MQLQRKRDRGCRTLLREVQREEHSGDVKRVLNLHRANTSKRDGEEDRVCEREWQALAIIIDCFCQTNCARFYTVHVNCNLSFAAADTTTVYPLFTYIYHVQWTCLWQASVIYRVLKSVLTVLCGHFKRALEWRWKWKMLLRRDFILFHIF